MEMQPGVGSWENFFSVVGIEDACNVVVVVVGVWCLETCELSLVDAGGF